MAIYAYRAGATSFKIMAGKKASTSLVQVGVWKSVLEEIPNALCQLLFFSCCRPICHTSSPFSVCLALSCGGGPHTSFLFFNFLKHNFLCVLLPVNT